MSRRNDIVIKDACILLDLVDLDLLKDFFLLGLDTYTTPHVLEEITSQPHLTKISEVVKTNQLKIDRSGQFEVIAQIFDENSSLSIADSSILELATRTEAKILSSDGSLRKISLKNDIEVRGILWIVEQLVKRETISIEVAFEKLANYQVINKRAPIKEIKLLGEKLKQQIN